MENRTLEVEKQETNVEHKKGTMNIRESIITTNNTDNIQQF